LQKDGRNKEGVKYLYTNVLNQIVKSQEGDFLEALNNGGNSLACVTLSTLMEEERVTNLKGSLLLKIKPYSYNKYDIF